MQKEEEVVKVNLVCGTSNVADLIIIRNMLYIITIVVTDKQNNPVFGCIHILLSLP
jgi:hypothetical protein